jgi:hypothetical protein
MRDIRNMSSSERTTVVSTAELLKTLKENRESHIAEYKEAVEGYLVTAREKLVEQHEAAKAEVEKAFVRTKEELERFDPEKAQDTIVFCKSIQFTLTAPRNFVDAYDQAIEMMTWETRDKVELNTTEFRCFIMNKWDWMEEFKNVSGLYKKII